MTDGLGDVGIESGHQMIPMLNVPSFKIYSEQYRWDQRICTFLFAKDVDKNTIFHSMAKKTLGMEIYPDLKVSVIKFVVHIISYKCLIMRLS